MFIHDLFLRPGLWEGRNFYGISSLEKGDVRGRSLARFIWEPIDVLQAVYIITSASNVNLDADDVEAPI